MKTQGRHGEVAVEVYSDVPDRFSDGMLLWALAGDGPQRKKVEIENFWPHKQWLVLKFAGIASISAAETLVGCELQVQSEDRAELEAGWQYVSDLVGCMVFDAAREVGKVEDIRFGAGEAPLLVVKAGTKEFELPYAEAYLRKVDLDGKRIEMALPEGLLDVNAPMTAEEKREQEKQRS